MAFTVSCDHVSPRWQLDGVTFADVSKGEWGNYRIGYSDAEAARRYYAIAPEFGCGRDYRSPQEAIIGLLQASASRNIRITEGE